MTQTVFTDSVAVQGSVDTPQLIVKGNAAQTNPLQNWQDNANAIKAQVTGDGRLQIGNNLGVGNPADALIQDNLDVTLPSALPMSGLHTLGRITATAQALSNAVNWVLHELQLLGTGGVSGLHTAMRARLTHSNTGTSTAAELRAAAVQTLNQAGTSGARVGQATGLRATASNAASAYLDKAVAVEAAITNDTGGNVNQATALSVVPPINAGTISALYGVQIPDLTQGAANYAIYTGQGPVHFGDNQELKVFASAPGGNPPSNFIKLYPKLVTGVPHLFAKDSAGVEYDLGSGGGDVSQAVVLAPASSTRNIVQPTGDFKSLILKNSASQTVNPFEVQASDGTPQMAVTASGNLGIGTGTPAQRLDITNGHLRFTPLAAPSAPGVAVNPIAGNLNGNYSYKIAYVTATGETELGAASATVSPANQQVTVTLPLGPSGIVTQRKIYRTYAGASPFYYYLATVTDNTTTVYNDNTPDGSLGALYFNKDNTTAGAFYIGTAWAGYLGKVNTALGLAALQSNTSGYDNTAYGSQALQNNTAGQSNVAVGSQALGSNTTGFDNTAHGAYALQYNTTGSDNTAQGKGALRLNSTGYANTAVGSQALGSNTMGYQNTAQGAYALQSNSTGWFNTAQGEETLLYNTTGYQNTAQGTYALRANTTGTLNTAQGTYALTTNSTGSYNTAQGVSALQSNTANSNTAQGAFALQYNTTGSDNTAQGVRALQSNTTGSGNTAVGEYALYGNTTAANNTAVGNQAGYNNTTGYNNIFIGGYTGLANTTGYNNTFIGGSAGPSSGALSNATAIGANALVSASNALVLGGTGGNAVNVGIGVAAPTAQLDVRTSAPSSIGQVIRGSASQSADLQQWQDSSGNVLTRMAANGNIGIGVAPTLDKFQVAGKGLFGTPGTATVRIGDSTNVSGYGPGVGLWSDGSQGFLSSVNFGIAWQNFTVKAADFRVQSGDGSISLTVKSTGRAGVGTTGPSGKLHVAGTTDEKLLIVQANSTQTASLQEWQNNAGTALAQVDANGKLIVPAFQITGGSPAASKVLTSDASGNATWQTPTVINTICQGRLTFASGVPVPTSDITAATTLYFTPYQGNQIALYNGSAWVLYTLTERSLSLSGLNANTAYDIFIYDNGGTLTLEAVAWNAPSQATIASSNGITNASPRVVTTTAAHGFTTGQLVTISSNSVAANNATWRVGTTTSTTFQLLNLDGTNSSAPGSVGNNGTAQRADQNTSRATALALQDGIYVKSGTPTWRYLGTIRTTATAGQCEDSDTKRFVWNYYNRAQRRFYLSCSVGSEIYAVASWRPYVNHEDYRVEAVIGLAEDTLGLTFVGDVSGSTNFGGYAALGLDGTISVYGFNVWSSSANVSIGSPIYTEWRAVPAPGYHFWQVYEMANAGISTTFSTYSMITVVKGELLG
jgi:hypothetical protein